MPTLNQNAAPLPKLDMSTSVPLNQPQNSTALPKLDMSTSVPVSQSQPMSDDDVKGSVIDAVGNSGVIPGGQETVGFIKGIGDSAYGIGKMIPGVKKLLPDQEPSYLKSSNPEQTAGKIGESIAEFATGDEALEGLAKATKMVELGEKYPLVAKTLQLAKDHPWLAKMIAGTAKGATVGGAQGAVKGSAEGDATGGAVKGAVGGAVGGAIGSAIEPGATNPVDALTRAVRPTGKLGQDFADKAALALPRLAAEHADTPITNLDELSDAAHKAATKLWNDEVVPQIQKHANETISGKSVADAIRGGVLAGDKDLFPEASDPAETFAKKFDGEMNLQQASDRLQSLNRKLSSLYKLDPASRYAATANNPSLEAMEDGANELRQQIYTKLKSLGEDDPAGLRQTYGALKTVQQAAEKRAIVYNRLAPINLAEQLATVGGALHAAGHLMVGDVPGAVVGAAPILAAKAAKTINSPEFQISKALAETGGAGARLAAKAGDVGANVGSQAGQGVEHMENEDDQQ
jgi:hypothetical protein